MVHFRTTLLIIWPLILFRTTHGNKGKQNWISRLIWLEIIIINPLPSDRYLVDWLIFSIRRAQNINNNKQRATLANFSLLTGHVLGEFFANFLLKKYPQSLAEWPFSSRLAHFFDQPREKHEKEQTSHGGRVTSLLEFWVSFSRISPILA